MDFRVPASLRSSDEALSHVVKCYTHLHAPTINATEVEKSLGRGKTEYIIMEYCKQSLEVCPYVALTPQTELVTSCCDGICRLTSRNFTPHMDGVRASKRFCFACYRYITCSRPRTGLTSDVISPVLPLSAQILHALAVLEERHIVHRDLKLDNIMVKSSSDLELRLIDFGEALVDGTHRHCW